MTHAAGPEVLTTAQAAELLQFSEGTLIKYAAEGAVPALKTKKGWRFSRRQLIAWIEGASR